MSKFHPVFLTACVLTSLAQTAWASAPLPHSFTDTLTLPSGKKEAFKMILVPGDAAKHIKPFYIGETEVSWDLFIPWSHWQDVPAATAQAEMKKNLRPANGTQAEATFGKKNDSDQPITKGHPAMGMTAETAAQFCAMLSQKTGRKYHLPTQAQWQLALRLGGGTPKDPQVRLDMSWCQENAEDSDDNAPPEEENTNGPCVHKIKTRKPNKLGLYDMLGNVAEWTQPAADKDADPAAEEPLALAVGGDFTTPVETLSGAVSKTFADPEGGHKGWLPKHPPVGFRLVCEVGNGSKVGK